MKTKSKALLMTLCAVLLVAASVLGTMAYLTSQDSVTNTFSIGKINITLDEAKVDDNGKAVVPEVRVKANAYKLMPGHEYDKDPTVHVTTLNSEDSYIFVKVVNDIADIEAGTKIAKQITDNGWKSLDGVTNVYYQEYNKADGAKDFVVFRNFTIDNTADATKLAQYDGKTVTITAYAIQKDGFNDAKTAWTAGQFK